MLTDRQKETFKDLKGGKLNSKQKADFYYRMSNILKENLEGLEDLSLLIEEIPGSGLEKIDLIAAATSAMKLTEKLAKRLEPSPFSAKDENGKYHIYRHFRVDLSNKLQGLTQSVASVDLVYEPTEEEVLFFRRLMYHIVVLQEMYERNERPNEVFTPEELDKKIASIVKGRPYTKNIVGMVGTPTEETAKKIMEGKPPSECYPNIEDAEAILKRSKEKTK
jgi:hypothetical protein